MPNAEILNKIDINQDFNITQKELNDFLNNKNTKEDDIQAVADELNKNNQYLLVMIEGALNTSHDDIVNKIKKNQALTKTDILTFKLRCYLIEKKTDIILTSKGNWTEIYADVMKINEVYKSAVFEKKKVGPLASKNAKEISNIGPLKGLEDAIEYRKEKMEFVSEVGRSLIDILEDRKSKLAPSTDKIAGQLQLAINTIDKLITNPDNLSVDNILGDVVIQPNGVLFSAGKKFETIKNTLVDDMFASFSAATIYANTRDFSLSNTAKGIVNRENIPGTKELNDFISFMKKKLYGDHTLDSQYKGEAFAKIREYGGVATSEKILGYLKNDILKSKELGNIGAMRSIFQKILEVQKPKWNLMKMDSFDAKQIVQKIFGDSIKDPQVREELEDYVDDAMDEYKEQKTQILSKDGKKDIAKNAVMPILYQYYGGNPKDIWFEKKAEEVAKNIANNDPDPFGVKGLEELWGDLHNPESGVKIDIYKMVFQSQASAIQMTAENILSSKLLEGTLEAYSSQVASVRGKNKAVELYSDILGVGPGDLSDKNIERIKFRGKEIAIQIISIAVSAGIAGAATRGVMMGTSLLLKSATTSARIIKFANNIRKFYTIKKYAGMGITLANGMSLGTRLGIGAIDLAVEGSLFHVANTLISSGINDLPRDQTLGELTNLKGYFQSIAYFGVLKAFGKLSGGLISKPMKSLGSKITDPTVLNNIAKGVQIPLETASMLGTDMVINVMFGDGFKSPTREDVINTLTIVVGLKLSHGITGKFSKIKDFEAARSKDGEATGEIIVRWKEKSELRTDAEKEMKKIEKDDASLKKENASESSKITSQIPQNFKELTETGEILGPEKAIVDQIKSIKNDAERLAVAEFLLGRILTEAEKKIIIEAHKISSNFSTARKLMEGNFNKEDARLLMRWGVCGKYIGNLVLDPFGKLKVDFKTCNYSDEKFVDDVLDNINKEEIYSIVGFNKFTNCSNGDIYFILNKFEEIYPNHARINEIKTLKSYIIDRAQEQAKYGSKGFYGKYFLTPSWEVEQRREQLSNKTKKNTIPENMASENNNVMSEKVRKEIEYIKRPEITLNDIYYVIGDKPMPNINRSVDTHIDVFKDKKDIIFYYQDNKTFLENYIPKELRNNQEYVDNILFKFNLEKTRLKYSILQRYPPLYLANEDISGLVVDYNGLSNKYVDILKAELPIVENVYNTGKRPEVIDYNQIHIMKKFGISNEEMEAFYRYKGVDSDNVNAFLRFGKERKPNIIDPLLSGLNKLPGKEGTFYRFLDFFGEEDYNDFLKDMKEKKENKVPWYDKGIMSVSSDKSIYQSMSSGGSYEVELIIESNSAKDIHFLNLNKQENELLVLPGTEFDVINIEISKYGGTRVYLCQSQLETKANGLSKSSSFSPEAMKETKPFEIKNNESKEESLHRLLQYLFEKYDKREKTEGVSLKKKKLSFDILSNLDTNGKLVVENILKKIFATEGQEIFNKEKNKEILEKINFSTSARDLPNEINEESKIDFFNETNQERKFFPGKYRKDGIPYAETMFGVFSIDYPSAREYLKSKLDGKTIYLLGGGKSINDLVMSTEFHPGKIVNIDPFIDAENIDKNTNNIYRSVNTKADDPLLESILQKDGLGKADEIRASFSVPFYNKSPEEVRNLFTNIDLLLKEGGNCRITPISTQNAESSATMKEMLKGMVESKRYNLDIVGETLIIHKLKTSEAKESNKEITPKEWQNVVMTDNRPLESLKKISFFSNLLKEIKDKPDTRILDLGCGKGISINDIAKAYPLSQTYGLDIRKVGKAGKATIAQYNLENGLGGGLKELKLADKNSLDFVYSFFTLQYMKEGLNMIDQVYQSLKPDGRAILNIGFSGSIDAKLKNVIINKNSEAFAEGAFSFASVRMPENRDLDTHFILLRKKPTVGKISMPAYDSRQGMFWLDAKGEKQYAPNSDKRYRHRLKEDAGLARNEHLLEWKAILSLSAERKAKMDLLAKCEGQIVNKLKNLGSDGERFVNTLKDLNGLFKEQNCDYAYISSMGLFAYLKNYEALPNDLDIALNRNGKGFTELNALLSVIRNTYADQESVADIVSIMDQKDLKIEGYDGLIQLQKNKTIKESNPGLSPETYYSVHQKLLEKGDIKIVFYNNGKEVELFPEKDFNGITNRGSDAEKSTLHVNIGGVNVPIMDVENIRSGYVLNFITEIFDNNIENINKIDAKAKDGLRLSSLVLLGEIAGVNDLSPSGLKNFIAETVKKYENIPPEKRSAFVSLCIEKSKEAMEIVNGAEKYYNRILAMKLTLGGNGDMKFTKFHAALLDMKKELATQYDALKQTDDPGEIAQIKINAKALMDKMKELVDNPRLEKKVNRYAFVYEKIMVEQYFIKPMETILSSK